MSLEKPLHVLVVDDSALMRNLISKMLNKDPEIHVPAIAMNGEFALKKIDKFDIDVITLDLEMPIMGGVDFLKERKRLGINVPVIVFSSIAQKGARITMEALDLGASDFILKPSGPGADVHKMEERLIRLVKFFGKKYHSKKLEKTKREEQVTGIQEVTRHSEPAPPPAQPVIKNAIRTNTAEVVMIGISTGGPNALRQILPDLDPKLPLPVLIVQHMPPGFTEELAKSLDRICPLEVKEAKDGDVITAGRVLIAPGGYHLTMEQKPLAKIVKLTHTDPVNGHRPSVDVLYAAASKVYHNRCIAVLMTGMGKDGVNELGTIYRNGGVTVAQEESSCIVPGMPGVAIRKGYADYIIHLDNMAAHINSLAFKYAK